MAPMSMKQLEEWHEQVLEILSLTAMNRVEHQKKGDETREEIVKLIKKVDKLLESAKKWRDELRSMTPDKKTVAELDVWEARVEMAQVKRQEMLETKAKFEQRALTLDERYADVLKQNLQLHSEILGRMAGKVD